MLPFDRDLPNRDTLASLSQQLAIAAFLTPLTADAPAPEILAAAPALADISPPVPHRILHCSWLI
jgi:hypothetical protein